MNKLSAFLFVLLFTACGCLWPFSGGRHHAAPVAVDDGISVEVLGGLSFEKVRKIYFEPLSAGLDAEAGEALDRFALMMVKGFSEGAVRGGRFTLVPGDGASTADAVIKGRIEAFKVRGHLKRTVLMRARADLRAVSDDEVLALVYVQRAFRDAPKDSDQAAYNIGYTLAQELSQ